MSMVWAKSAPTMRAFAARARAKARSPVPQQRSRTRASGRLRIGCRRLAVRARQRRSSCNDKRWLSRSYRGAICVNISRTFLEASASVTAPSGRVPLTGAAISAMTPSQMVFTCRDQARCEMENALDDMKRNRVVGARLTDARREHEAQDAAAHLFIGAHGIDQSCDRNARPGCQRAEAVNQCDDSGNIIGRR